MEYTEEQFSKLPKWAQSEINRLKNNNKGLTEKLEQFNGQGETNTYLVDGMDKKPLPKNSHIDFMMGERNLNRVSVYVRSNGMVDINADSRLGHDVVILPRAANSFYISFIER